jgi:hypothetical protein
VVSETLPEIATGNSRAGWEMDSVVSQAKRKRHCRSRFFHFSRSQPRDTIAYVAFGNGLEIVKIRGASVRRRRMMQSWADYLNDITCNRKVGPLDSAEAALSESVLAQT